MDDALVESVAIAIYQANGGLTHVPWAKTLPAIRDYVRIQARSAIVAHNRWTFDQMKMMQDAARAA